MRRWHQFGVGLCLGGATLAVYAQVYDFEFISLDDPSYVTANPAVRAGVTVDGLCWALTSLSLANWHPLTWLSHMLTYQLFGPEAGMHHLVNVFLHAANGVLLFIVLERLTGALWRSAFVAALFALHPVHVESVAWVSERKDVLSGLFAFLTLWAYARYVAAPGWGRYLLVVAGLAVGLAAKPMLVTLPLVLLLLDLWPLRRVPTAMLLGEKVPLLVLAAGASVLTVVAQRAGGAVVSVADLSLPLRLANALLAYVRYVGMTVWPRGLAFFYPYPPVFVVWQVLGALLLVACASVLVLWAMRRRPYLAVGWFWYLGMLVPVIGLVQVGDQSLADRYMYLPSIGLFIIVAWGLPDVLQRWRHRTLALAGAGAAVVAAATTLTWVQVGHWRNSVTLSEQALAVTADNYQAHFLRGMAFEAQGRIDAAMAQYVASLRSNPGWWGAHANYAVLLAKTGQSRAAVRHYREALRLWPDFPEAHSNLGVELAAQGQLDAAIAEYRTAIRLAPDLADAYRNLGTALAQQGKSADAAAAFNEAARLARAAAGAAAGGNSPVEGIWE